MLKYSNNIISIMYCFFYQINRVYCHFAINDIFYYIINFSYNNKKKYMGEFKMNHINKTRTQVKTILQFPSIIKQVENPYLTKCFDACE